ncbi:hypothetical protein [Escherichia coli]|uniref:hypothetical protein n=1 Tax=Escherichia coli TaxID=562 RepID=UPI0035A58B80
MHWITVHQDELFKHVNVVAPPRLQLGVRNGGSIGYGRAHQISAQKRYEFGERRLIFEGQ